MSECIGHDITDINFRENSIRIIRKGGNESILYFGTEVEKALLDYIEGSRVMAAMKAVPGEEMFYFSFCKKSGLAFMQQIKHRSKSPSFGTGRCPAILRTFTSLDRNRKNCFFPGHEPCYYKSSTRGRL